MASTRIPRRIHILDYVLKIQQVSKRELQRQYGSNDRSVVGLWNEETLEILLYKQSPTKEKRKTLLHELLHALTDLVGFEEDESGP